MRTYKSVWLVLIMPGLMVLNVKFCYFNRRIFLSSLVLNAPNLKIMPSYYITNILLYLLLFHNFCIIHAHFWMTLASGSMYIVFLKLTSLLSLQCLCLLLTITIPWVQLCHHHLPPAGLCLLAPPVNVSLASLGIPAHSSATPYSASAPWGRLCPPLLP